MGLLNIFLVGLLFAYMFYKSGSLWMPVGYHITWNFFQGNIFGFPVSGTEPSGIYTIINTKDNLITGGGFGPEGGILATAVIIICALFVFIYCAPERESKRNYDL
jgi:membrane protease YdiL (CAAX protease family)